LGLAASFLCLLVFQSASSEPRIQIATGDVDEGLPWYSLRWLNQTFINTDR